MFLIGCPPCTAFCTWQHINEQRRPREIVEEERRVAKEHMKFICELYVAQHQAGRYFIHEHPEHATSWNLDCVAQVQRLPHVSTTVCDQCQYGQETDVGEPIKKGTKWLSNSEYVLEALSKRCHGRDGNCSRAAGGKHKTVSGKWAISITALASLTQRLEDVLRIR